MWKWCSHGGAHRAARAAAAIGLLWMAVHAPLASAVKLRAAPAPAAAAASAASAPAFKPSPYASVARQHAQAASATPLTNTMQNLRHHKAAGQGHQ
jgi:hypothetical protein